MKVLSLNCNHCGAPIDAPVKAKFVTCSFCDARLTVQRTGSSYSTEILEELQATTQSIARDVAKIKTRSEVEDLDRSWTLERSNYMVQGKHGHVSKPSKTGAIVMGVFMGGFGLFWSTIAMGMGGGVFSLFGFLFVAMAIFTSINMFTKADAYERAEARYRRKRRELMQD